MQAGEEAEDWAQTQCYSGYCEGFLCIQKVQLASVPSDNALLKKTGELGFCQCEQAHFVDKLLEAVTA